MGTTSFTRILKSTDTVSTYMYSNTFCVEYSADKVFQNIFPCNSIVTYLIYISITTGIQMKNKY